LICHICALSAPLSSWIRTTDSSCGPSTKPLARIDLTQQASLARTLSTTSMPLTPALALHTHLSAIQQGAHVQPPPPPISTKLRRVCLEKGANFRDRNTQDAAAPTRARTDRTTIGNGISASSGFTDDTHRHQRPEHLRRVNVRSFRRPHRAAGRLEQHSLRSPPLRARRA